MKINNSDLDHLLTLSRLHIDDSEKDDYGRPFVDPKGSRTYMDPDEMTPYARFKKMMGEKNQTSYFFTNAES